MATPNKELQPISDLESLYVLRTERIQPQRTEYLDGRYVAYYDPDEAKPVLSRFEAGQLQVNALAFCTAIRLVKNSVFEAERLDRRAKNNGDFYAHSPRR